VSSPANIINDQATEAALEAAARERREQAELEETWARRRGVLGFLTSTNHKDIGLRFIFTALTFFLLAGLLAVVMRLQLAFPSLNLIGPDLYNQFFTMHGSTMMFLFAVPVMEGFAIYLVPLMVGARNTAFPRLMAFGYWIYLFGGITLWVGLLTNTGADMGWFAYVPLSGPEFTPGKRTDVWSQMVTMVEIGTMAGAVSTIATIFKLRAPGMSLDRMPLFVWASLVMSFMVLFAMPSVTLGSSLLSMDRLTNVSTHFFNPAEGGDALLYQHLFWFFGHPDVYIIFIPATGFVSAITATFCRRRVFGYVAMVLALVTIAFIGFGVWVHHMFATPLPELGQSMFTAASLLITVPSGIQIFCWIATMWGGKVHLRTPMLWVIGFIATFVIGGLTGVMLASTSIDLQVHDTFFVVAHFHYVLIGGAVFPLLGAIYYWFPKWTGRMLSERLGRINFALVFIGFHLTFWPMHHLGLHGMPRRVYTYVPETGWGPMNLLATIGAGVLFAGVALLLFNMLWSYLRGEVAGDDPWGGETLEWSTASPPPTYSWVHPPTARGRSAMWDNPPDAPVVVGMPTKPRQMLSTTTLDARPDHRYEVAGNAISPLLVALAAAALLVLGGAFHPVGVIVFSALIFLPLAGWFWSSGNRASSALPEEKAEEDKEPEQKRRESIDVKDERKE
jgi:cytochrome c oxidase subunit 1